MAPKGNKNAVGNSGRPTSYKAEYCTLARNLTLLGKTDEEVAEHLKINAVTVHRWKKKYPEFCNALKEGKEPADGAVVKTLYQKALGGDTTAMIFWLKNRQRRNWRDRTDIKEKSDTQLTIKIDRKVRECK